MFILVLLLWYHHLGFSVWSLVEKLLVLGAAPWSRRRRRKRRRTSLCGCIGGGLREKHDLSIQGDPLALKVLDQNTAEWD